MSGCGKSRALHARVLTLKWTVWHVYRRRCQQVHTSPAPYFFEARLCTRPAHAPELVVLARNAIRCAFPLFGITL